MGKLVNATGKDLSSDMACPSTIEPYVVDESLEEVFFDESSTLALEERVAKIIDAVKKYPEQIEGVIIDDNPLGRLLFKELKGNTKVVSSVKRPNSNLHWYWQLLDSFPEPEVNF